MSMLHVLSSVLLAPVLLVQGKYVRKVTPKLPEPKGEREAKITARSDSPFKPLSLLIIGDSSAAGVGVEYQQQALSGQIVECLSTNYQVTWVLHAQTGAKTSDGLKWIENIETQHFDWVISVFGVNDVTSGTSLGAWKHSQQLLRERIKSRFCNAKVIVCGLPPMHGFPALPQPLRWYLGQRATEFDKVLKQQLSNQSNAHYLDLRFTSDTRLMASDGFHPGRDVYRLWAEKLEEIIRADYIRK